MTAVLDFSPIKNDARCIQETLLGSGSLARLSEDVERSGWRRYLETRR